MQYRSNPKNEDQISALGFGCMRFHKNEGEVEKQILYAIEKGVNYFDTAYIYQGSEALLGKILAKNKVRDKVFLATKLPHYLVRNLADADKMLQTELGRLQTNYIDYYLLHMIPDEATWLRLQGLGIEQWIADQKAAGKIRNIGFSFHGMQPEFMKLIDAYDWDFCMIQYNYLDENYQAGTAGLLYAASKGMPVMVMEPLRGGSLVNSIPPAAQKLLQDADANRSNADWGLRWVLNHPEVTCVLSGMGTQEMVAENIEAACSGVANGLSEEELALYPQVSQLIRGATKVECTGCGYCMPCPAGVEIPMCFSSLNDTVLKGKFTSMYWYALTTKGHGASNCIQCGKCEAHCPQNIPIREKLAETKKELEGFPFKPMRFVLKRVFRSK